MHIGHYISGAAHIGVIGIVLFGGAFQSDPPPFEVTGVSIVTAEQFDALNNARRAPLPKTDVEVPVAPLVSEASPTLGSQADSAVQTDQPEATQAATPDGAPDLSGLEVPQPADVADEAPSLTPPDQEMAVLIPRDEVRPTEQPAPRVAPEPVARPEPDTRIDDVVREAVTPDDSGAPAKEDLQEATAQEEASTEIVTEAKEQVALAPKMSIRPVLRPSSRPKPRNTAGATKTDASIAAALAEAQAEAQTRAQTEAAKPAAPSGPPLSRGEKDALRVAVQKCWVVDVGGRSSNVTVTVGLKMSREGKVEGAITLLDSQGGDDAATKTAFEAARRAVLRCQKGGYKLPIEKYDHWRDIEITFNPEKMRLK